MLRSKVSCVVRLSRYRHLLSAAVDNELDSLTSQAVEKHALACRRCGNEMARLRLVKNVIVQLHLPETNRAYPGTRNLLSRRVDSAPPVDRREKARIEQNSAYGWSLVAVPVSVVIMIGALILVSPGWRHQQTAGPSVESRRDDTDGGAKVRHPEEPPAPAGSNRGGNVAKSSAGPRRYERGSGAAKRVVRLQEIKVPEPWDETSDERGSEADHPMTVIQYKVVRFRFNETPVRIDLPENSKKGKYVIQLRPATLVECTFCPDGPLKSDGRTLLVRLPLQNVDPGHYTLLVARKDDSGDEEYIGRIPLLVENPDASQKELTK